MKKLFTFGAFVCLVAFSACGDDKQADVPVVTNDVIEKEVITSSFTFRVHATFTGLTEDDQLYGRLGVFYIEKGADTESLFQKWADSGSAGKLKKKNAVVQEGAGVINLLVDGLTPNTEYQVCPFFQASDNSKRIIGKVHNIKTNPFGSTVSNLGVTEARFFSADTKCTVSNLDSLDSKYCYFGLQYAGADQDITNGKSLEAQGNPKSQTYELKIASLNANTEYKFRPYLAVKSQDTIFGEIKSFNTRDYDEAAVDLGTSVLWSKFFLGSESEDESGDPYRFGQTESVRGGQYAFVDINGYFTDACPDNISGTEFDAATKKLGEGWRIPTKKEIQELLDSVRITAVGASDRYKTKLKFTSKNGNSITLPQTDYCYAYTRKVNRYNQTSAIYFFAADMEVEEPIQRISYHYDMTDEMFNELLNEMLDKYLEEHPSATVIYTKDLLEPLIDQGLVWFDTTWFSYKSYTMFEPNNSMYYITPGGDYAETLRDGKWNFMPVSFSYGDYAFCILPVRDRVVKKEED